MLHGMSEVCNKKNVIIAIGLLVLSVVCSWFIKADYEAGLVKVFWVCILTGMAAYMMRYIMDPNRLFYLFIFTIPIMNILSFSYKYILPLGVCFVIYFIILVLKRQIRLNNLLNTRNGRLLFIYVLLNFIILPYSINKRSSGLYVLSFPVLVLVWDWIVQYFNSEKRIIGVLKAFNFIGVFYSILGIIVLILNYQGYNIPQNLSYTKVYAYYVNSVFPNTNTHGMLLTFTIPCALYLALETRDRAIYYISFFLMGVNLLLTFSRSSWGAAAIAVAIMLLYKYRKAKYAFIVVILAAVLLVHNLTGIHIAGKFSTGIFGLSSRGVLWDTAVKAIKDRPVIGFGVGNSVDVLSQYSPIIMGRTPHNTLLRMWLEMGIFGLLIYIVFIYNIISGFFTNGEKKMLIVTLFAVLMGSLFQQMFETMLLGGLSIIGGYFFIFSALFESVIKNNTQPEDERNENLLFS